MKKIILISIATALALGSCCVPCTSAAPQIGDLEQATWTLIELDNNSVENSPVTLKFNAEEKTIHGTALCNNFFGGYTLFKPNRKEKQNVKFSNIGATMKMCPDMDIEQQFTRILTSVTRLKIEGEHLLMINAQGELAAVLVRAKM